MWGASAISGGASEIAQRIVSEVFGFNSFTCRGPAADDRLRNVCFKDEETSMALSSPLSRRDALKLGVLGSAALLLPFERRALTKNGFPANRIASGKLPRPYTQPFRKPPVLAPVSTDATTDYYVIRQRQAWSRSSPGSRRRSGATTASRPGRRSWPPGRQVVVRQINQLPDMHPTLGYTPGRPPTCTARRRCRSTTATPSDVTQPGQCKDYHYPNIQDARTLWYHDHGVHHTAENAYMGLAGAVPPARRVERRSRIPQGALRRPADPQRRDVRARTARCSATTTTTRASAATSSWSTACRGRS